MRESRVENYLARRVKAAGGAIRKLVWPGRRHAPDRMALWPAFDDGVVCVPACIDLIETKAPGKKPRPGQRREFARLAKLGHPVRVIDTHAKVNAYMAGRRRA